MFRALCVFLDLQLCTDDGRFDYSWASVQCISKSVVRLVAHTFLMVKYSETRPRCPWVRNFTAKDATIKKHQNSLIWLTLHAALLIRPRVKNISRLRRTKSSRTNTFFTHLIHFTYQDLKQFPRVSMCSIRQYTVLKWYCQFVIGLSTGSFLHVNFTQQNNTTS
jgi:hypothetical protein